MYNARIETTAGDTVHFGYEHGTVFDISPLSGVPIDVKTSQGFQQVGVAIDNVSVGGITRKISGNIIGDKRAIAEHLLTKLPLFTEGKLYFNDEYYCNIVVSKTPEVKLPESGVPKFMMQVFCGEPYWMSVKGGQYVIGHYEAAFHFPVIYDSHIFGIKSSDDFTNVYNNGDVRVQYSAKFYTTSEVTNFGLVNANNLKYVKIFDTITIGQVVEMYWKNGRLLVEKTVDGVKTDIFRLLDENSDLFWMGVGDNIIKVLADDDGADNLMVSISFAEAKTGVV